MTSFIGCLSDIVLFCYGQAALCLRMPFAKLLAECGELFFFELLQMLQFFHDANHISILLSAEGKVVVVNDGTGDDGNDSNGEKGEAYAEHLAGGGYGDNLAEANGANELKAILHGFSKGVEGGVNAINEIGNDPINNHEYR